MLLHLRHFLEQFLLSVFVYFYNPPFYTNKIHVLRFVLSCLQAARSAWLILLSCPCWTTEVGAIYSCSWCNLSAWCLCSALMLPSCALSLQSHSFSSRLTEHYLYMVEIMEDTQSRWLNNCFMSIWFYCFFNFVKSRIYWQQNRKSGSF